MKTRITENDYHYYFGYATSAREGCIDFCDRTCSAKSFVKNFYHRPTRQLVKSWLNHYGVEGTREKIRKILHRFTDDGLPKFRYN